MRCWGYAIAEGCLFLFHSVIFYSDANREQRESEKSRLVRSCAMFRNNWNSDFSFSLCYFFYFHHLLTKYSQWMLLQLKSCDFLCFFSFSFVLIFFTSSVMGGKKAETRFSEITPKIYCTWNDARYSTHTAYNANVISKKWFFSLRKWSAQDAYDNDANSQYQSFTLQIKLSLQVISSIFEHLDVCLICECVLCSFEMSNVDSMVIRK